MKKAANTKGQPWIVLKLMVPLTVGIMGYAAYVYIGRFCLDMIKGLEGAEGSRGTGSECYTRYLTMLVDAPHSCISCRLCYTPSMDGVGVYQGELLLGNQVISYFDLLIFTGRCNISRLRQRCMQLLHFSIYMYTTQLVPRSTSSSLRDPCSQNLHSQSITPTITIPSTPTHRFHNLLPHLGEYSLRTWIVLTTLKRSVGPPTNISICTRTRSGPVVEAPSQLPPSPPPLRGNIRTLDTNRRGSRTLGC